MIANMAMSDLLFPIFLFPLNLVEMQADICHISDPLYQTLCKIGFFLSTISAVVSIQSLILITVDRFGAVVVPIRSPLISKRHCPFFIIASWIVAVAAYSPCLFSSKLIEHPGEARCTRQTLTTNIYQHLAVSTAFFYIPFVLLIILYSIILIKLKQHVHPGEQSANAEEQRLRRNWNVLKMAIVIVLVFFFAGSPPLLTGQYYISHRTVPFGSLAIFYFMIPLPTSWPLQTALSTRWSASFSAVIIAKVLRDFLVAVLQCKINFWKLKAIGRDLWKMIKH